jgi:hypothetical protein
VIARTTGRMCVTGVSAIVQASEPLGGMFQERRGRLGWAGGRGLDLPRQVSDLREDALPVDLTGAGHRERAVPAGQVGGVGIHVAPRRLPADRDRIDWPADVGHGDHEGVQLSLVGAREMPGPQP